MTDYQGKAGLPRRDVTALTQLSPVTEPSDDLLTLRREEVAALTAAHRRARLSPIWGLVPFPFGFGAAAALAAVGDRLAWPSGLWPLYVTVGALLGVGIAVLLSGWERRRLAPFMLACPECSATVLSDVNRRDEDRRAELVVATGCCPSCGSRIVVA